LGGFTMAEILLSLTIIGVVAAITLPSLTGNINERTWNTQRKALYARMSQAIALMPALNGYGTLTEDESGSVTADNVAETFVTAGLSKVLKLNNICDGDHLEDCGIASKLTPMAGAVMSFPIDWQTLNPQMIKTSYNTYTHSMINSKAAAFETANGESVVVYYNPRCKSEEERVTAYLVPPLVCANFIFDLNGTKGPNTVGKDIGFMTVLYSSDSKVVAPFPTVQASSGSYYDEAAKFCREQENSRIPNKEEAISLFVNRSFSPTPSQWAIYTSSSPGKANRIIHMGLDNGMMGAVYKTENAALRAQCIKR
ncbi:MAG: type II secretion system GspH family protein, partial [Fusobacterium sp.]|nr:type II secretion system GspH family protein [Fusobacterium sp.]